MAGSFILNGIEYFGNDGKNIFCQEVTQAQYNALPASKLTDGVMYFITDASDGATGFPPLIYSDQEREIGVWKDGKPLYQKTISNVSLPQVSNWALLDDTISYDKLIYIEMTGGSEQYPVMPTSSTIPRFRLDAYALSDHKLYYYSESNVTETITLRYTKTIDTAGSGTWTTQGGYAHHYSTTEQVIGTWIDGKPLYEKVFNISDTSCANNQWEDTGISKGSIKNIVKVVGFYGDDICFDFLGAKAESTDTNIMVLNTRGSAINLNRLILQYTKTTD